MLWLSRTMFPHIRQTHPLTYALSLPHHPFRARSSSLGFLARNIHRDELLNTIEAEVRNNIVKLTPAESASFPRDSGARALWLCLPVSAISCMTGKRLSSCRTCT